MFCCVSCFLYYLIYLYIYFIFRYFYVLCAACSVASLVFFIIFFIYLLYFLDIFMCCVFWCVSRFLALLFEFFSFLSALCPGVWSPDVSVKYVNITQSDESLLICSLNSNAAS